MICPGACNSAWRRATAIHTAALQAHATAVAALQHGQDPPELPAPPQIRPWDGDPVWCPRCTAALRRQLAELDDLAALLAAQPPDARAGDDSDVKVSGSPAEVSPSAACDELDDLAAWMRSWESLIRGTDPLARRGFLATELTASCTWLTAHFDIAVIHPDYARDFGTEIRQWHAVLTERTRAGRGARHVKRPCPRCALYTLWEEIGQAYIRCVNTDCGRLLTREELAAI